jgi:hypothetical protein
MSIRPDFLLFLFFFTIVFVSVSLFGHSGIYGGVFHHGVSCFATMVLGRECSDLSPWGIADFHITAFKALSLGIVQEGNLAALFLSVTLLLIWWFLSFGFLSLLDTAQQAFLVRLSPLLLFFISVRRLLRWRALHENSPTIHSE